jgi:hypothetical protein
MASMHARQEKIRNPKSAIPNSYWLTCYSGRDERLDLPTLHCNPLSVPP